MKETGFILKGDICYSEHVQKIKTVEQGYVVCVNGKSGGVYGEIPERYKHLPIKDYTGKLIIPGMVDLHIHAPQFAFRGLGMDMELLDWLQNYAFVEEAKYEDPEYAKEAYGYFVDQLKMGATTHVCVFATRHRLSTELLMDLMEEAGLESYIGKVNMDREAPENLCELSAEESAEETIKWLEDIQGKYTHTKPILTPRFIPSCTDELMNRLKQIQSTYGLPLQSHLSENLGEIEWVKTLCPNSRFYGDAYDQFGLFGKEIPTIMAHCVYSSHEEIQMMKDQGVFVAHCAASNMNLGSGIAPVRKYLDEGLNMGLGSDVAGGHTESMFATIAMTLQVSQLYWRLVDQKVKPLTFDEAFYLATMGGGKFFGKVGSFEEGYDFSAVVLDDRLIPHPGEFDVHQRLARAVYLSLDAKGICAKYINDRVIME